MNDEIRIDKISARQGSIVPGVRYVLAGSLALALIAFVVLMSVHV